MRARLRNIPIRPSLLMNHFLSISIPPYPSLSLSLPLYYSLYPSLSLGEQGAPAKQPDPPQPPSSEPPWRQPKTKSAHPGVNPGANLKTISHRCYLREVAFVWE